MRSLEFYNESLRRSLDGSGTCKICHCSEDKACAGGCCWTEIKDVCSRCRTSAAMYKGILPDGLHPWCCAAILTTPSTVYWHHSKGLKRSVSAPGWAVRATDKKTTEVMVHAFVRFCPFCAKELPDEVEFKKLYATIRRMGAKKKARK